MSMHANYTASLSEIKIYREIFIYKNVNCCPGCRKARTAERKFGAAGRPGAHVKPLVRAKGRKFESARGRRESRGYKKQRMLDEFFSKFGINNKIFKYMNF